MFPPKIGFYAIKLFNIPILIKLSKTIENTPYPTCAPKTHFKLGFRLGKKVELTENCLDSKNHVH